MIRFIGRGIVLFVLFAALGPAAHATIVLSLSEQGMARRAHLILEAQVVSQRMHRVGKPQHIVTDSVLRVQRFLKGRTASSLVTVRTMGGTVGALSAAVSGESQLVKGRRVLVFLEPAAPTSWEPVPTHYYIVNMAYGAYHIFQDPHTGQAHAVQQSSLPAQIQLDASGRWRTLHRDYTPASQPLQQLRTRIQEQLKALQRTLPRSQQATHKIPALPSHKKRMPVPQKPAQAPLRTTPHRTNATKAVK